MEPSENCYQQHGACGIYLLFYRAGDHNFFNRNAFTISDVRWWAYIPLFHMIYYQIHNQIVLYSWFIFSANAIAVSNRNLHFSSSVPNVFDDYYTLNEPPSFPKRLRESTYHVFLPQNANTAIDLTLKRTQIKFSFMALNIFGVSREAVEWPHLP